MRYVHVEMQNGPREVPPPSDDQIRQVMEKLNVVVDVSPEELREVIEQSLLLARESREAQGNLFSVGRYYGSRRQGRHWSVRQIVNMHPESDVLDYRIVEGKGRHHRSSCTRAEFARWAGRELHPRKPLPEKK